VTPPQILTVIGWAAIALAFLLAACALAAIVQDLAHSWARKPAHTATRARRSQSRIQLRRKP